MLPDKHDHGLNCVVGMLSNQLEEGAISVEEVHKGVIDVESDAYELSEPVDVVEVPSCVDE